MPVDGYRAQTPGPKPPSTGTLGAFREGRSGGPAAPPSRKTDALSADIGTRSLTGGTSRLQAYSDAVPHEFNTPPVELKSVLQDAIGDVKNTKNAVNVTKGVAVLFVAEEEFKGVPLGKALKVLSSHLKSLGDVGNAVRGIISTGQFVDDARELAKDPAKLKDPNFLLQLGYDTAGTASGVLTDLKYVNSLVMKQGTALGGRILKLEGAKGKLNGLVRLEKDGAKVFDKDGNVVKEISGELGDVKDLGALKDLGVDVSDVEKVVPVSALGEFVGKAAPIAGPIFGTLGIIRDAKSMATKGVDLDNSLDLASNLLTTAGSVALLLPPPADAVGGAMLLASGGIALARLGIKNLPKIEHFAGEVAQGAGHLAASAEHGAENLGHAVAKKAEQAVVKEAGQLEQGGEAAVTSAGNALKGGWNTIKGWF